MPGLAIGLGFSSPAVIHGASNPNAEADAYMARAVTAGAAAFDTTHRDAVRNFVTALKLTGAWSVLDAVYLLAAHDAIAGKMNVRQAAYDCTGSPTFTANGGFVSDGSTTDLKTGFIPTQAGGNWSNTSASIWGASMTNSASTAVDMGAVSSGSAPASLSIRQTAVIGRLNVAGNSTFTAGTTSIGVAGVQRVGTATKGYRDGANVTPDTTATAASRPDNQFTILSYSGTYAARRYAFVAFGGAVPDPLSMMTAITDYLTAISAA